MFRAVSVGVMFLAISMSAQADFMCPSSYKYIDIGDSMGEVLAACGEPADKKQSESHSPSNMELETLIYRMASPGDAAGLRYELTFADEHLIRIKAESGEIETLDTCQGDKVRIGMSIYDVISNCGTPVNRYTGQVTGDPTLVKVEEWHYKFDNRELKLRFVQGALNQITPIN